MEEVKVHILHEMFSEFKNYKNLTETAKKICSFYSQNVITDSRIQNWFSNFRSGDTLLRDEFRPG